METTVGVDRYWFSCAVEQTLFQRGEYEDYKRLGYEKHSSFCRETPLLVKPNGEAAFLLSAPVPIFDSEDSAYDSRHTLYLMRKNGQWDGIFVSSGFCGGTTQYCENSRGKDRSSTALLEKFKEINDALRSEKTD